MINFDELDPQLAYEIGELERAAALKERKRIIDYLMEHDILRDAMFYAGYVAFNTAGTQAMDLPLTLGGEE